MSQRGIRIKLLVFDGKITISYTNYVFENATKNFVNPTKEPVYKAHGPNRLAENYTNTTLCGRKQAAIKRKTDAVEHRLEQPGKRGSCRMRNNPFRIFLGGGGLTKYVRAQGGRPRREREEIVRAPRGKLLPEAGDRPAPAGKLRRPNISYFPSSCFRKMPHPTERVRSKVISKAFAVAAVRGPFFDFSGKGDFPSQKSRRSVNYRCQGVKTFDKCVFFLHKRCR